MNNSFSGGEFYEKKAPAFQKIYEKFKDILSRPKVGPEFRPNFGGYSANELPALGSNENVPAFRPNFGGPTNIPLYHQAKAGETLSDVSNQYGIPLQQLADINKSKTMPPKGSYIQLQQLIQQGVPTSVAEQIAAAGGTAPRPTAALPGQPNRGDPAAQQRINQATAINKQIASGQNPTSIPVSALGLIKNANGELLTLQAALQSGYVLNNAGMLVLGGAGGKGPSQEFMNTQAYQTQSGKDFLQQGTYINGKYMKIGDAIRRGLLDIKTGRRFKQPMKRNKQGKLVPANRPTQAAAPVAPVTNVPIEGSREGPQTILDIHLGSG